MSPIALTREEIDEYMLSSPRGILCVSRNNLAPLALPMWFGWIDGKIVMTTLAASKKTGAVRRSPAVSFLVESGEEYFTLKALLILGNCRVDDDPAAAERWQEAIFESKPLYRRLFPEKLPRHLEEFYRLPRVALIIETTSITSWNFAKVRR